MKILVTGAAGRIGRATIERLVQRGWDVRGLDKVPGVELPGAEYVTGDLRDFDTMRQHMRGCGAVIHLAAIPSPQLAPGHEVFHVNVAGTYNVFEAAAQEGIKRVVQASSINALGCAYSISDISFQYFPVDEQHPSFTNDPYSLSKELVEDIASYYWRRDSISSVSMRFPWVYAAGYLQTDTYAEKRRTERAALDALLAMPDAERTVKLAEARAWTLAYRAQRPLEFKDGKPTTWQAADDMVHQLYNYGRFNFWTFVDVRDAAQSLEKGVTAQYDGAHFLYINDPTNWLGYDAKSLVRLFYPEVSDANNGVTGAGALLSPKKAMSLIGFAPEYGVEG
jgi:nucleoside-diphosphate-sugar epimerase